MSNLSALGAQLTSRRCVVIFVALGLLSGLAFLAFARGKGRRPVEPFFQMDTDPRLTFSTPYRNVAPEVAYVGDARCAQCHPNETETYRHHPMGRSLAPVASAPPLEHYDEAAHNPFKAWGFEYQIERQGSRLLHKETRRDPQGKVIYERAQEVRYVLGSGTRGRAYLIDHDGYLFQSPISWYTHKGVWDQSPGYEQRPGHFQRMIQVDCLFCHSNAVEPVADTFNRYQAPVFRGYSIGCERCHGPGALHVALRERGEPVAGRDETIVNPGHLEPALREAVCQQCHLEGDTQIVRRGRAMFDFRPGLPLERFRSIFVRPAQYTDDHRAVSHVGQMYASRCFRASNGRLGCISCHDPHALPAPAERIAYYRARCMVCHEETSCSLPVTARRQQNPADDCAACHMPRTEQLDIAHTAQTDHRILREPEATGPGSVSVAWLLEDVPLWLFPDSIVEMHDGDLARDLGLALVSLANSVPDSGIKRRLAERALPLFETSLHHAPNDVPALDGWAAALRLAGQKTEAFAVCQQVLARAPRREVTLAEAAPLAAELGQEELALEYWQRILEVNPWSPGLHLRIARFLASRKQLAQALEHCQKGLKLNPSELETRVLQVQCLLALGRAEQARAALDTILRFDPPNRDELRRWFKEQLRLSAVP
jgi:Flp pilus assembly protein TadD